MMQDVELGLKRSATITFAILEKVLMLIGEVGICLRPSLIPTISQMILVDHWVLIVIFMTEVDIGLRPANFIHIIMVDHKYPTQGFLKRRFQGVWEEEIHIEIIIFIIIQAFHHMLV